MESTVKLYRVANNKSQEYMAEVLSVNHKTYLNKEKKRTSFTANEYLKLKDEFGLSNDQLVKLIQNMEV